MALPTRTGPHRGRVVGMGVTQTKSGLAQVGVQIELDQWYGPTNDGGHTWYTLQNEDASITFYGVLENKDGAVNEINQRALMQIGWDGWNVEKLNDDSLVGQKAQVFVDWEEYNGTRSMRAKFLKAYDADPLPGVRKAAPNEITSMQQRLQSKLRATAGSVAAPPPGAPMRPTNGSAGTAGAVAAPPAPRKPGQDPPYTGPTDELPF